MTFKGIYPPVVTPFTPDGDVDFASLEQVIEHLIDAKLDGLFVLGSTGEMAYLTDAQRVAVVEAVVARVGGRVPILAGAMDMTQARVIGQARAMCALGVDGIVVTAPFYALNSVAEVADHFRLVKAAIGSTPLFAYDIPVRLGGLKLAPELLVELGREGVLTGVKDSSGNDVAFRRLLHLNAAAGRPLACFTGHECLNDAMLLAGADGQVPGYANVDPYRYRALADAAEAGDWDTARELQDEICAGFEIVYVADRGPDNAGVGAFKVAMQLLGIIDSATQAAPMKPFDPADVAAIKAILDSARVKEALSV